MNQLFTSRRFQSESGVYLVSGTILILVLAAGIGLAIDTARVMRAELQLQRALDAAVVSSGQLVPPALAQVNLVIANPPPAVTPSTIAASVATDARSFALQSLRHMGADISRTTITSNGVVLANPPRIQISMSATMNYPTWMLQLIPSIPHVVEVDAQAVGVTPISPTLIQIIIDTSQSMRADIDRDRNSDPSRIQLNNAVQNFMDLIPDNGNFHVGTVVFSDFARTLLPISSNVTTIKNTLSALGDKDLVPFSGDTNLAAALLTSLTNSAAFLARPDMAPQANFVRKFIVLFTDGAPSPPGETRRWISNPTGLYNHIFPETVTRYDVELVDANGNPLDYTSCMDLDGLSTGEEQSARRLYSAYYNSLVLAERARIQGFQLFAIAVAPARTFSPRSQDPFECGLLGAVSFAHSGCSRGSRFDNQHAKPNFMRVLVDDPSAATNHIRFPCDFSTRIPVIDPNQTPQEALPNLLYGSFVRLDDIRLIGTMFNAIARRVRGGTQLVD